MMGRVFGHNLPPMDGKVLSSFAYAVGDIDDGAALAVGGFGVCGVPGMLIAALRDAGTRDLTVISNSCCVDDFGLGILLASRQVRKMVSSYFGEDELFEAQPLW